MLDKKYLVNHANIQILSYSFVDYLKARQHYYFFISVIIITITLLFAHEFLPDLTRRRIFQLPAIDTLGHLTSFFILTWVSHSILKLSLAVAVPLLIFYGALTEVGQSFLGFRNGEFGDFLADVVGIFLFVFAKWFYLSFVRKTITPSLTTDD